MSKNLLLFIAIFIVTIISIKRVFAGFEFTVCDEAQLKGTINWINVTDCDPNDTEIERCIFKKGENVTIRTSFTPHESISQLKIKITGTIYRVSVPWNVSPDNACNYGLTCPITKDEENHFIMTLPISSLYPSIKVTVKLSLRDSSGNPYVCIQFPAKIEN